MAPRVLVYDHLDHPLFELDPSRLIGLKMVEKVNADHTLTITTTQELEKGQRIFISVEGKVREYVVTGDNASHTDGFTHEYYCVWSLMNDLSGDYIDDRRIGNKNDLRGVADILAVIVENNRWEVGTVSNSNLSSAWLYYTSAWDALGRAVEQWYGEVDTTITLGNPIVRRLDFLTKQGDQTPKRRFDYGYDLTSIKRTVLDDLYVCRIVPRGKGEQVSTDPDAYGRRITIEDVNPTGEEWIQDDDAALLTRLPDGNGGYDYPTQIVIFESIEDPQELYDTALAELETYTRPKVSYAADVLALSGAGMDVNGVELGDAVHVVDTTFGDSGLRLSARVMGIERDLLDPSNDKLTIGNFQPQLADVISKLSDGLSAAQEQLIDTDGKADAAMDEASASVQIANAAQGVANAVNQHFWDDSDGAHVTEVTKDEWNDALGAKYHTGANTLWNTLGMLFRNGLDNLLAVLAGSTPATRGIAIYDGLGNASTNIIASFTGSGAVIGKESERRMTVTSAGLDALDADGTVNASFGQTAIIGRASDNHVEIKAGEVDFNDGNNTLASIKLEDGYRRIVLEPLAQLLFTRGQGYGYSGVSGDANSDGSDSGIWVQATGSQQSRAEISSATIDFGYAGAIAETDDGGLARLQIYAHNNDNSANADVIVDGGGSVTANINGNNVATVDSSGDLTVTGAISAGDPNTTCSNLRAVGYTAGMNAAVASFVGANQQWGLRAKVINANNTDFLDHSTYIMLSNNGLRGYDATDQSYFWQLDLPSGTTNLATTTQSVTPANSTATTFQLRKSGKVVQLVIYQLKVSSSLANGSNISIAASGAIPSAYRPSSTLYAPCMANVANFGSGTFITIATGGGITLYNRAGASLATSTNLNCTVTWIVA